MLKITSRQHDVVKTFRALAEGRGEPGDVLLDGEHLITTALDAGVVVRTVVTDGRAAAVATRAEQSGALAYEAGTSVLDAVSPVRTTSGIVAVATWTPAPVREVFGHGRGIVIGMSDVQDPGNGGGIIRSSHALGANAVVCIGTTADPASWKALRGSMGSTFHMPVARASLADALAAARSSGYRIAAAVAREGTPVESADLRGPLLLLVGNEGAGLPPDVASAADVRVSIPMRPDIDSLNVGVTAAVILWEATRHTRIRS